MLFHGGISCWTRGDVAEEGGWGRRRAEDARGGRGEVGDERGGDGELVAYVYDPTRELYAMNFVSVFECANLVADGIERDVVAYACVWFVEGIHEWWSEEKGNGRKSAYMRQGN